MALNSLQFNRVVKTVQVEPQGEMRWKLFGIVVSLHFLLLFEELKEKVWVEKVWFLSMQRRITTY